MSEIWGPLLGVLGTVGIVVAGLFTARATKAAAAATAEATRAAAQVTTEPDQRRVDLDAYRAIWDNMQARNDRLEARQTRLEALVRAFTRSADRWCAQMRRAGIDPEPPDPLVEEYHRTGV